VAGKSCPTSFVPSRARTPTVSSLLACAGVDGSGIRQQSLGRIAKCAPRPNSANIIMVRVDIELWKARGKKRKPSAHFFVPVLFFFFPITKLKKKLGSNGHRPSRKQWTVRHQAYKLRPKPWLGDVFAVPGTENLLRVDSETNGTATTANAFSAPVTQAVQNS